MRHVETWECPSCEMESEYIYHGSTFKGVKRHCDPDCKMSHNDLLRAWENEMQGRSESRYERQFADYHGASTPQTDAERAEVAARERVN